MPYELFYLQALSFFSTTSPNFLAVLALPIMQRQDSFFSDEKAGPEEIAAVRKRTSTWKSSASSAHARTTAQYKAEAVPEPKEIHK